MWKELFKKFDKDTMLRMQAIFASIFVLQNRLQTAGDKIQTKISMKQWLLMTMANNCPEPRTLTNIGNLMGCSRQNVKKLAVMLEKKGFVNMNLSSNNSVLIELTQKADEYSKEISQQQMKALKIFFAAFSNKEIESLFLLYEKLFLGIENVENFARGDRQG